MQAKESYHPELGDDLVGVFMVKLMNKIDEAKDMLIERFDWICSQDASAAAFM